MSESAKESKSFRGSQGLENIPKFLKILYQLLEDKAQSEFISWSLDGRAIAIKNPTDFAEKILPVYFKHSNYSSFVRQLNLYNFRKKKHYPYDNTFAHTMFLKGRKDLLKFIKRKNSHMSPQERENPKIEAGLTSDSELNDIADQNTCLKRIHYDMMERIESMEQALGEMSEKNQVLRRHYLKKKQNEEFLKKVVNQVARVHGAGQIRAIIESFSSDGVGHSLHLKPLPSHSHENEKAMSSRLSYSPMDRSELRSDNSPHLFPGQDFDLDRNSIAKSNFTLSVPHLKTISSLSTNPDLNHLHDLYEGFDPEIDNRQSNYNSGASFLKSAKSGLEDFSITGESRRECLI